MYIPKKRLTLAEATWRRGRGEWETMTELSSPEIGQEANH